MLLDRIVPFDENMLIDIKVLKKPGIEIDDNIKRYNALRKKEIQKFDKEIKYKQLSLFDEVNYKEQ